jgi:hypothetical protein
MTELLVQLKGHEDDLNVLCSIFCSSSYRVSREGDGYYYLRSSYFTSAIDEEDRVEYAAELVRHLNVAARLLLGGNYFSVDFDGVARVEGSGEPIVRSVGVSAEMGWAVRSHYKSVSPEEAEALIARLDRKELNRITNLLARSLNTAAEDKFRSFVFGWTALEIFINKVFRQYEKAFVDAVISEADVDGASRYFERVTQVMEDKYRLVDKFSVIAAVLCGESSDADIDQLKRIKKARDNLVHGQDILETSLPNTELRELMSKYLREHINYFGS